MERSFPGMGLALSVVVALLVFLSGCSQPTGQMMSSEQDDPLEFHCDPKKDIFVSLLIWKIAEGRTGINSAAGLMPESGAAKEMDLAIRQLYQELEQIEAGEIDEGIEHFRDPNSARFFPDELNSECNERRRRAASYLFSELRKSNR